MPRNIYIGGGVYRHQVNLFTTVLYLNIDMTLIPSVLWPNRTCGPEGGKNNWKKIKQKKHSSINPTHSTGLFVHYDLFRSVVPFPLFVVLP